ncbi:MAG: response regulator transcription factor [Lentimicrobium sp.]
MDTVPDYKLYLKLFETYLPSGFQNINPLDPMVAEVDKMLKANKQFLFIGDVIQLKYLYVSKNSMDILGIEPEKVNPRFMLSTTHDDDFKRHILSRLRLIKIGQELYGKKNGYGLISTNFRANKTGDNYIDLLYQGYFFYSNIAEKTVYLLMILTDISDFSHNRKGFHFYTGEDLSYFRYPDPELLAIGNIFSRSEFRILQLIEEGRSSEQIAEILFRSVHTIETHRRNIIKKSGKISTNDVIIDLKNRGLL